MKTKQSRIVFMSVLAAFGMSAVTLLAQAPAGAPGAAAGGGRGGPGGGGPGGRGGAPAAPTNAPATTAQILAVSQFNTESAALTAAVNTARSDLTAASFALPANSSDIAVKANALATAELNLALSRANWIAGMQSGANALNSNQLEVLRNQAASGGGGRGGFSQSEPLNYDDMTGFVKIFDGETLDGWSGGSNWMVDDGAISSMGGIGTTYIIYNKQKFKNFELKLEFKIVNGANTGVQYRSRLTGGARSGRGGHNPDNEAALSNLMAMRAGAPAPTAAADDAAAAGGRGGRGGANSVFDIGGYQFDIGGRNQGQLYEQDGRGIIVYPGEVGILEPGLTGPRHYIVGKIGGTPPVDNPGEWNHIHLIADGPMLVHITNDELSTVSFDNDPNYVSREGWLALQIEGGGQLWFRNIYVKPLPDN